jgi:hypothetical protein
MNDQQIKELLAKVLGVTTSGTAASVPTVTFSSRRELKERAKQITCGRRIEPTDENFSILTSFLSTYQEADVPRRFMIDMEPKIDDPRFFWKLFRYVVRTCHRSSQYYEQFDKALKKSGRLDIPTNERIVNSASPDECMPDGTSAAKATEEIYSKFGDEVTLHRGFLLRGENRVRAAASKDSPEYYLQNEGRGYSFTTDLAIARSFAARSSIHYGKNGDQLKLKKPGERTKFQLCMEDFYIGGHPTVAEFRVPKDKILLVIPERSESEVWVNPLDVSLVRYYSINSDDIWTDFVKRWRLDVKLPEKIEFDPDRFRGLWRKLNPPM